MNPHVISLIAGVYYWHLVQKRFLTQVLAYACIGIGVGYVTLCLTISVDTANLMLAGIVCMSPALLVFPILIMRHSYHCWASRQFEALDLLMSDSGEGHYDDTMVRRICSRIITSDLAFHDYCVRRISAYRNRREIDERDVDSGQHLDE